MSDYRVLQSVGQAQALKDFAVDVLVGLSESPKHLSSRYFYDAAGSRYFQQITDLGEYYLTQAEYEILQANRERLTEAAGSAPFNLVDLGAGDGRKTLLLLEQLIAAKAEFTYVPIDISVAAMEDLTTSMRARFPELKIAGLVSEYLGGIQWLCANSDLRNLVLFLGSNIGNFDMSESRQFLRRVWNELRADDLLLIGFDLKKDIDSLLDAYNDSQGITSAFNLNLLARINRELGGHFDLDHFVHFSTYNVFSGAMEMYLISLRQQQVLVEELKRKFSFRAWEPVQTEFSFKFLDEDVLELADQTGYVVEERFWDREHRFCDALWRVEKVRVG